MTRLSRFIPKNALSLIGPCLALSLLAFGIFIDTPLYQGGPTTPMGLALEQDIVRYLTSLFYIVPAIVFFTGGLTQKQNIESLGLFGMFLGFLFNTILRVVVFGLGHGVWIFTLALCVISALVYFESKSKRFD